MALREFEGVRGEQWRVWDNAPFRAVGQTELRNGWLTFDNGTERRRLAPVPDGWADFPAERLMLLLRMAQLARDPDRSAESDWHDADRRHGERRVGDRREHR